jgi:L-threonylcarbamoyladenylate synthase
MSREDLDKAVHLLRDGRLVAFPTETVYGLGADATNPEAVARIFQAKGRPATNPVIVHVAGIEQARRYTTEWSRNAQWLAEIFWPGPLTIVVPRAPAIAPAVSAGLDTVGLRAPRHALTLELLRLFDGAVAAPSANRSNRISPTTAGHVLEELGDRVDLILDGGQCDIGIESTVITLCTPIPTVLRPGDVELDQLRAVLGRVDVHPRSIEQETPASSPGQHPLHYAPQTPCFRYEGEEYPQVVQYLAEHATSSIVMLALNARMLASPKHRVVGMPNHPPSYARHLYCALREADASGTSAILIEMPPDEPEWFAIRDRLTRATVRL